MMYSIDGLMLLSGIDIPILELRVNLHQPTLKEIAYIGEKDFYQGVGLLSLNKEELLSNEEISVEDKAALSQMSTFQIIMSTIGEDKLKSIKVQMVLSLLFPEFSIEMEDRFIMLINPKTSTTVIIDENNFEVLQNVIAVVLCLNQKEDSQDYNPEGQKAKEIAAKLKKHRERVKKMKGEATENSGSALGRYISSLAVAMNSINIKSLFDLTLYQLFDQLERYVLYSSYNVSIQARMAGAKDVEEIDWLKNIH